MFYAEQYNTETVAIIWLAEEQAFVYLFRWQEEKANCPKGHAGHELVPKHFTVVYTNA